MRERALATLHDRTGRPTGLDCHVLIVDDHAVARHLAVAMLDAFGAQATTAGSAEEAVEWAATSAFDAVLLDFCLPDADGPDLARRLAALPGTAGAPILAVTGRARPAVLPPHVAGWIEKPFGIRDLHAALDRVARRRRAC